MKTIADILTENLEELNLLELTRLKTDIEVILKAEITEIKAMHNEHEYKARKYLMNKGLTHSESLQFIKDYIH